jgi:hypothetical protein
MPADLAILRGARLALDHYGGDALDEVARRADDLLEHGDVQGYEIWSAILGVLEAARARL